ncbi:MAG TPA: type I phosphomannose isomerase catalytic subunit [Myxococcota bacterium]
MLPRVLGMRPRYVEKLWGGSRLRELPAKLRPGHAPAESARTGESWEVADLPEGCSLVDGGPLDGTPLRALVAEHGRAVVGARAQPGSDGVLRFPLLVKLIDAGDDLSVQVHPDADYARAHPGTFSKDEAWLVVARSPGAQVLHGLRDGVTREKLRAAIADGTADKQLRAVRVSVGDVLRIAPGTMHAVGAGCLLLEVQEPSDTTFRVFDYNRVEANGKTRPLHVEQAMAVARFGPQEPPLVADAQAGHRAINTPLYAMSLAHVSGEAPLQKIEHEPAVVFVLEGTASIDDVIVPAGGTALVTAAAERVPLRAPEGATVVVMTPGSSAAS